MITTYTANGIRYVISHRELHARTFDERAARIKPDKGLLSRAERGALMTISREHPNDGRLPRHKRAYRK